MRLKNKYFLLRHGETVWQTQKPDFTYPWPDNHSVKLTAGGKKTIEGVAKKLKKIGIDMIYSSDFFRTRQTAEIAAKELGLKINFDKRLRDLNLGIYHGGTKKDFYKNFSDPRKRFSARPPKGESWNDVKKRMLDFLKEIDKKNKGKTILIVSHGDPLWLLECAIKGMAPKQMLGEIFRKKNYIKVGKLRKL